MDLIQQRVDFHVENHREQLRELGPDFLPLIDEASSFLSGGKRLRAQFLILGFRAVRPINFADAPTNTELTRVLDAATALEFFHAAALIHDDIIDQSDTRRGRPSAHKVFASQHNRNDFRGSAERFGTASAILLGDLLQSWADELLQHALDDAHDPLIASKTRAHFNRMRSEVAVGQYLDVLEEQHQSFAEDQVQLERSTRVLIYKSAKYSVQAPILIGASMAGATPSQEQALSDFGLPVGVAFQLRDDLLGVFGDETLTGKPTGDDLREGKRTVLVALAREKLPSGPLRVFDDLHGTSDLEPEQIQLLQQTISEAGATQRVEQMITKNIGIARESLTESEIRKDASAELIRLAEFAGSRSA